MVEEETLQVERLRLSIKYYRAGIDCMRSIANLDQNELADWHLCLGTSLSKICDILYNKRLPRET